MLQKGGRGWNEKVELIFKMVYFNNKFSGMKQILATFVLLYVHVCVRWFIWGCRVSYSNDKPSR